MAVPLGEEHGVECLHGPHCIRRIKWGGWRDSGLGVRSAPAWKKPSPSGSPASLNSQPGCLAGLPNTRPSSL